MLLVIGIMVIDVQKQLQCLHGVLCIYIWAAFVRISDRSSEWALFYWQVL